MVTRTGGWLEEQQSPDFSFFDPQCPPLNPSTSHCTVRCAFIVALLNMHFSFVTVGMKHIRDIVLENYSASGTCIIFSQVIAMVIQRAEPQNHEIIISSDLTCITDQFWAVHQFFGRSTDRKRERGEEKKTKTSLSFS